MTADAFDRLLYTDCLPGTGRGGGGGFQVQAQSSGVDPAQSELAVGMLLYEVQNAWIVQRREVDDFPLGFAHASGAGYGTAQSWYLGKEATGGRPGNHLADCLLTHDTDLYGTIRPAQLWRSSLWRAEPWETRDCPQFKESPEPGPLTLDAVTDWIRERPERTPVLSRLLSVLEDPAGSRVVIVTDDADEAMTWIAAATLLLPERRALDISFKVFSNSPLRAVQRVVAAPAELNPQLAPSRTDEVFVLDATACAADDAPVSVRAAFLIGRLTADCDPYDVIDAVELAEEIGEGTWPGGTDALVTGWALTRPDDPLPDPGPLFRWLSGAGPGALREHGPAVADILLQADPGATALRWIDDAAAAGRLEVDPAVVRPRLLAAELAEVRAGQGRPGGALRPVTLSEEASRDAASELSSAMLLSPDWHQVDLLLRLTRRHGIDLDLSGPLRDRLHDFAVNWVDRPTEYHPDGWALSDTILDSALDELRARFAHDGKITPVTMAAVRQLYRHFMGRAPLHLTDPFDCQLYAAALAALSPDDRMSALAEALTEIRQLGDPATAARAAAALQRALTDWDLVDPDVAIMMATRLPGSAAVEPTIAAFASEWLERTAKKPDRRLLEMLANLEKHGWKPSTPRLTRLVESDRDVREFAERADGPRIVNSDRYLKLTIELVTRSDRAVIKIRLSEILTACLASQRTDLGGALMASLKSDLAEALVDRWASGLTESNQVGRAVWAVRCLANPRLQSRCYDTMASDLRKWKAALGKQGGERWRAEVRRRLDPELHEVWEAVFAPKSGLRWITREGG
jgi:GTPase-associated protein 1, N-terminal domain type 2/GTPase-associated protein 1, middle domain